MSVDDSAIAQSPRAGAAAFWRRFGTTFGPALLGLLCGVLTLGAGIHTLLPLLRSISQTYSQYPSLESPGLVGGVAIPGAMLFPLYLIGIATPFVMGYLVVRLGKPRDWWETVSSGLTSAATASAVAYVLWIGWTSTMALVIVPSISDLTLLGNATRMPTEATAQPSDRLTDRYPDLKTAPADERGDRFFPKIVSDQVVGSAFSAWYGVLVATADVGIPMLCGTFVAAWLVQRPRTPWHARLTYLELTIATAGPLNQFVHGITTGVAFDISHVWLHWAALSLMSGIVMIGAIQQWSWPVRIVAAVSWCLISTGSGLDMDRPWAVNAVAYTIYASLAS